MVLFFNSKCHTSDSSRDLKVGLKVKQHKKKKSWSTFFNLKHFEGKKVLDLQNDIRMTSSVKVQNEINLHNQEKKAVNAN
jgi:hypothetical protein